MFLKPSFPSLATDLHSMKPPHSRPQPSLASPSRFGHFVAGGSVKPSSSSFPTQESRAEILRVYRFPRKGASRTVMKPLSAMTSAALRVMVVSGLSRNLPMPGEHLCTLDGSWLTPDSNIYDVVIYGYWIGPDTEDGWGYVEATVDQNF